MKKEEYIEEYILVILVGAIFIIVMYRVIVSVNTEVVMQDNCCDGKPCSDTYYTHEDNKCHLVLCENSPLLNMFNKSACVYDGLNKSYNAIYI
jgi:hypothetical protein